MRQNGQFPFQISVFRDSKCLPTFNSIVNIPCDDQDGSVNKMTFDLSFDDSYIHSLRLPPIILNGNNTKEKHFVAMLFYFIVNCLAKYIDFSKNRWNGTNREGKKGMLMVIWNTFNIAIDVYICIVVV